MKAKPSRARRDEIDQIVDSVVTEPSRAGELKRRLHVALGDDAPTRPSARNDDGDDLWDNLPI